MKIRNAFVLVVVAVYVGLLVSFIKPIEIISFKMTSKTLKNGKTISANGMLYFRNMGGQMVTHLTFPFDYLIFSNSKGEMKVYDIKDNTVTQNQNPEFSSENSFIYQFLNGRIQDLGLTKQGYKIKNTKIDKGMVITTWQPPSDVTDVSRVELVHEKNLPIYIAFFNGKNQPSLKTYYSSYQTVGDFQTPGTITEIQFTGPRDSVITKRWYSDPLLNESVDRSYLDFKIPANAKVIN